MTTEKDKKLAEALRLNLLKRKQQKRLAGDNEIRYRQRNIGVSPLIDSNTRNKKK